MRTQEEVLESIDRRIAEWHKSDTHDQIWAYLGWSLSQYTAYVEYGIIPTHELLPKSTNG